MNCKLCKRAALLCASHIIPEFLFSDVYDEKHRGFLISSGNPKPRFFQKGMREHLLCSNCEKLFSSFESYFSRIWRQKVFPQNILKEVFLLKGIEYRLFKLFHLSILWRMSISSVIPFRKISLGHHEDVIRKMLIDQDPGSEIEYPLFCVTFLHEGKAGNNYITAPGNTRSGSTRAVYMQYGGCQWTFILSRQWPNNISLKKEGILPILVLDINDNLFLIDLLKRHVETITQSTDQL